MTKDKWHGHIAIFSANILFGLNIPIAKTLMPEWIDPVGLTFLRMSFGALAFWATSLFVLNEKVSKKDLLILFFCAILGTTINQLTFIQGLGMTSPIDAGLIVTMNPMMVMLISALILKEPITSKKAGGVLIGACGAVLIIWHSYAAGTSGGSGSSMTGNLLCFISVICYATYLVISKPIAQRYSPVTLMKWMFLFSTILMAPFSIQDVVEAKLFSADTTFTALSSLFYVVFAATFLAYFLIPIALKRIRPTTISMYNYAQPLVASTLAIIIGQDHLTWDKPVAAVLVFTGVYLVTQSKSRADMEISSET
jgi:hypothetical protein